MVSLIFIPLIFLMFISTLISFNRKRFALKKQFETQIFPNCLLAWLCRCFTYGPPFSILFHNNKMTLQSCFIVGYSIYNDFLVIDSSGTELPVAIGNFSSFRMNAFERHWKVVFETQKESPELLRVQWTFFLCLSVSD